MGLGLFLGGHQGKRVKKMRRREVNKGNRNSRTADFSRFGEVAWYLTRLGVVVLNTPAFTDVDRRSSCVREKPGKRPMRMTQGGRKKQETSNLTVRLQVSASKILDEERL